MRGEKGGERCKHAVEMRWVVTAVIYRIIAQGSRKRVSVLSFFCLEVSGLCSNTNLTPALCSPTVPEDAQSRATQDVSKPNAVRLSSHCSPPIVVRYRKTKISRTGAVQHQVVLPIAGSHPSFVTYLPTIYTHLES